MDGYCVINGAAGSQLFRGPAPAGGYRNERLVVSVYIRVQNCICTASAEKRQFAAVKEAGW